jgi:hypothetical protein
MNIVKLFADLQTNPTKMAYKEIASYYKSCNRNNEAEAFEELIKEKYGHRTPVDQKQQQDNTKNS